MTSRTLFIPENGETLIGVIRPSLWTLVYPLFWAGTFILFPFIFAFALLGLGAFGLIVGVLAFLAGVWRLRRVRRRWLCGSMYVTDQRVADLVAIHRQSTFVSLPWREVDAIHIKRRLVGRLLGLGNLEIKAVDGTLTLVTPSVHDPESIRNFLVEVQLQQKV